MCIRDRVVKQADLVLAMHGRGDAFSDEQKARNFAYYEPLTVRDSSLSACTQAVIAAEVGQLELAYDYFGEAALMDLGDLEHNVRDGGEPGAGQGGDVNAVADVVLEVAEVHQRRLAEVVVGQLQLAYLGRDDR